MRYLYLVRLADGIKRSYAFEKPEDITLDKYAKAESKGFTWIDEEQAIAINLEIPNSSEHYGIITQARIWEVPVKIEDNCIWIYAAMRWYGVWPYHLVNKIPGKKVMEGVERIYRNNTGTPVNHDVKFVWQKWSNIFPACGDAYAYTWRCTMGLEKMITASAKVVAKNIVELHPGGTYNLNEDNEIERRVVNLHLLGMFADMAAAELACNGECRLIAGQRMEGLAEDLFDMYKPFIENGVNIFDHDEFYDRTTLAKYTKRSFVNGYMNASPEESTEGLPEGWWYEWPGQARKMFSFGLVVIDIDECLRVGIYDKHTDDEPTEMIMVTTLGDYREVWRKFPDAAFEIQTTSTFVQTQYQI